MKLFKWLPGRQQGCAYFKYCFLFLKIGKWGFDGYILLYPPKSFLPPHKDPIEGKMWRVNIKLKGKSIFYCKRQILSIFEIIHVFRPDHYTHSLYAKTTTIKLSFGIAKFDK